MIAGQSEKCDGEEMVMTGGLGQRRTVRMDLQWGRGGRRSWSRGCWGQRWMVGGSEEVEEKFVERREKLRNWGYVL